MSKIVVNLGEEPKEQEAPKTEVHPVEKPGFVEAPAFLSEKMLPKKGGKKRILMIVGAVLGFILLVVAIGGFLYWQNLKSTPQYSLALLVDAARRNDQKAIDELLDTDAIIEDFIPQVTDKAVELYGRGLPQSTISKIAQVASPLMPSVKQFARNEVPGAIRDKTKPFENYPFWAIAIGAGRYLDIAQTGEIATVKSKIKEHQLELTMKKKGALWQVVAIRDEALARRIAEKYGQEMISAAKSGSLEKTIKDKTGTSVEDLKKSIEDILK